MQIEFNAVIALQFLTLALVVADIILVRRNGAGIAKLVHESMPDDGATMSYRMNKAGEALADAADSQARIELAQTYAKLSLDNLTNAQETARIAQALAAQVQAAASARQANITQNIATRQEEIGRDRVGHDKAIGNDEVAGNKTG